MYYDACNVFDPDENQAESSDSEDDMGDVSGNNTGFEFGPHSKVMPSMPLVKSLRWLKKSILFALWICYWMYFLNIAKLMVEVIVQMWCIILLAQL